MAQRTRNPEAGFTLVELLVVIAIMVLLTGVVVFAVGGITDRGESAACEASSGSVRTAAQTFLAAEGDPAPNLAALIQHEYLIVDDDVSVSGNVITTEGGTITYQPSTAAVSNTCA